jgi:hypothetical protein
MRAHVNVVRVATSDYVHALERAAAQAEATAGGQGQAEGVSG